MKAAAIGEAAGLLVAIGSQCELGIGTAAMAHAAVCMPNLAYESDITGHLRYPVDIINETLDYARRRDPSAHGPRSGCHPERGSPCAMAHGCLRCQRCRTSR